MSADGLWRPVSGCGPDCLPGAGRVDHAGPAAGGPTGGRAGHARARGRAGRAAPGAARAGADAAVRGWARGTLRALGIRLVVRGRPPRRRALLVANHVSWLDVLAVLAVAPARLLAKREVRAWPLVGRLAAAAGTIFVDRAATARTAGHGGPGRGRTARGPAGRGLPRGDHLVRRGGGLPARPGVPAGDVPGGGGRRGAGGAAADRLCRLTGDGDDGPGFPRRRDALGLGTPGAGRPRLTLSVTVAAALHPAPWTRTAGCWPGPPSPRCTWSPAAAGRRAGRSPVGEPTWRPDGNATTRDSLDPSRCIALCSSLVTRRPPAGASPRGGRHGQLDGRQPATDHPGRAGHPARRPADHRPAQRGRHRRPGPGRRHPGQPPAGPGGAPRRPAAPSATSGPALARSACGGSGSSAAGSGPRSPSPYRPTCWPTCAWSTARWSPPACAGTTQVDVTSGQVTLMGLRRRGPPRRSSPGRSRRSGSPAT